MNSLDNSADEDRLVKLLLQQGSKKYINKVNIIAVQVLIDLRQLMSCVCP